MLVSRKSGGSANGLTFAVRYNRQLSGGYHWDSFVSGEQKRLRTIATGVAQKGEAQARLAVKMVPERRRVYRDSDKLSTDMNDADMNDAACGGTPRETG